jgi:hypothetical protein
MWISSCGSHQYFSCVKLKTIKPNTAVGKIKHGWKTKDT